MKRIDYIFCFLLGLIAFISRVPFLEKYQSFWGGPQLTIGIVRYSFEQQTPAAPGYPYFVGLGKFFHLFFSDLHTSIVAVSVLASITGAITLYIVGLKMYNRMVGIAAATIFLTGSTFYFFSIAPHPYDLLITTIPLLAYSVYRIFVQKEQEGIVLGLIIGMYMGLRPQDIIQLGILCLLGFITLTTKEKLKASIAFISITLTWFIPVTFAVGFTGYFVQSIAIAKTAVVNGSILQHGEDMVKGLLLSFGICAGFLIYFIFKRNQITKLLIKQKRVLIFYTAWVVPGFLYNLLLRSDAVGYQFSYLTALLFLISFAIWQLTKKNKYLFIITLACIALFNLYWFFYDRDPTFTKPYRPVSYHYSEVKKNDIKVGSKVQFVKKNFDPKNTYIVTLSVLWRPYSYYLKNYYLSSLSGLDTMDKRFKYDQIDTINWNMNWHKNYNFVVTIPANINTIVFLDDSTFVWIKNYPYKTYHLPGNSVMTTLTVNAHQKLKYGYHKITISR